MQAAFVVALILSVYNVQSAVVHSHSHSSNLNKERESDGAYSPRDKGHLDESGEHHNEFDHEAILGSAKTAEEFDHLTPEESKRRLGILLMKMDLNGDRSIDKRELKAWILRSFKSLTEEEAAERLEEADENEDGKVTWEEYANDAYGLDSREDQLNFNEQMDEDKVMWNAADVNGDGILEGDEWVAFTHPEEHPAMLPHILAQTLKDKDKDNDGSLSFQEYVGDRGQGHDKEWLTVEKERFDNEYDKNHDGKLTGNEILSWVVPSNDEIAEEETDHLFASSDDDHDDLLNFQEVTDHYDIFVGSEATDYGEHIHNIHQFEDEL